MSKVIMPKPLVKPGPIMAAQVLPGCPQTKGRMLMCHNYNSVNKAMAKAKYKQLDDGTYYGKIAECPGVWANKNTLEKCRKVLHEVLEEWFALGKNGSH